jgi:Fe-S oxidoreductase
VYTLVDSVCCGSPLKRTGTGGKLFDKQVITNMERIHSLGIKKLIFSCAGCYKTFKQDYPKSDVQFVHLSEFLNCIDFKMNAFNKKVAYHDPCHLGRGAGLYEQPRQLLQRIPGITLIELPYNRGESHCCGGGGGVRAAYPDIAQGIAKRRMNEARSTGVEILVTSCPFCVDNLKKGDELAKTGIKVMDIMQLVAEVVY